MGINDQTPQTTIIHWVDFGTELEKSIWIQWANQLFFYKDTSLGIISAFTFINSLKKVSSSKQFKGRKIRKCISGYSKACELANEMAMLYQKSRPHKDGSILEEDSYQTTMLSIAIMLEEHYVL